MDSAVQVPKVVLRKLSSYRADEIYSGFIEKQKRAAMNQEYYLQDYIDFLFVRKDGKRLGYISYATKDRQGNYQTEFINLDTDYDKLFILINRNIDKHQYLSFQSYKTARKRTKNNILSINACYVDLDIYTKGRSINETKKYVDDLVLKKKIPNYTFFNSSGQGCYAIWKLDSDSKNLQQQKEVVESFQGYLVDLLKDYGADSGAKSIVQQYRIPNTMNLKTNKASKIVKFNALKYNWKDLISYLPKDQSNKTNRKPKTKKKVSSKVYRKRKNIFVVLNPYTLHKKRAEDIETLVELRGYDITGSRNNILFVYHYLNMRIYNNDVERALEATFNLNAELVEPMDQEELRSYLVSSERAAFENEENDAKGYNYRNDTLIQHLEITKEEQQYLQTIIDKEVKAERRNARERKSRRNKKGLTKRKAQKVKNYQAVITLFQQGYKQKDISDKLSLSKSYVSKIIREYREKSKEEGN